MEIKPHPKPQFAFKESATNDTGTKLGKAFEISTFTKELFLQGLQKRFPDKGETEIKEICLQRLLKCYNRNY